MMMKELFTGTNSWIRAKNELLIISPFHMPYYRRRIYKRRTGRKYPYVPNKRYVRRERMYEMRGTDTSIIVLDLTQIKSYDFAGA